MALSHQFVRVGVGLMGVVLCTLASCTSVEDALHPRAGGAVGGADLVGSTADLGVMTARGYRVEPVVVDLCEPVAITVDPEGNLYVAEQGVLPEATPPRILRVAPTGHIDVLTDRLSGPVHCIRWEDGRLVVWDGEGVVSLGAEGESRRALGEPGRAPERMIVDGTGAFAERYDRFVIVGGRLVRKTATGEELFLGTSSASQAPRRLVDIAFGPGDKVMYVADLGPVTATSPTGPAIGGNGVIWRIMPEGAEPSGPPAHLSPPQQFGVSGQATRPSGGTAVPPERPR